MWLSVIQPAVFHTVKPTLERAVSSKTTVNFIASLSTRFHVAQHMYVSSIAYEHTQELQLHIRQLVYEGQLSTRTLAAAFRSIATSSLFAKRRRALSLHALVCTWQYYSIAQELN